MTGALRAAVDVNQGWRQARAFRGKGCRGRNPLRAIIRRISGDPSLFSVAIAVPRTAAPRPRFSGSARIASVEALPDSTFGRRIRRRSLQVSSRAELTSLP